MVIQILVDNFSSWIVPWAKQLTDELQQSGHDSILIHRHEEVREGDILCILSCEKVFRKLELNKHNLVVHESDLPSGKGWSPLTWKILEGKNRIPVTLFEAANDVDSGAIYAKEYIRLDGSELLSEIKKKQGELTKKMILDFVDQYPDVNPVPQVGESTYYPRRTPEDSELDPSKTLEEQFNLLRVCDNEKYPAFFVYNGNRYILKIYRDD